jgi:hypothetical protein
MAEPFAKRHIMLLQFPFWKIGFVSSMPKNPDLWQEWSELLAFDWKQEYYGG